MPAHVDVDKCVNNIPIPSTEVPSSIDQAEYILETKITWKFVEEKVTESLKTKSKFGPNKMVKRIGLGQGFLSIMGRVYPNWTPHDSKLPKTVILKIPTYTAMKEGFCDERICEAKDNVKEGVVENLEAISARAHNAEVSFYEVLKGNTISAKVPKTYFLQKYTDECDQGIIIMEDAGEDSAIAPLFEIITVDEIKQVFESLAEIHCLSLKHPKCLNISNTSVMSMMDEKNQIELYISMLKAIRNEGGIVAPLVDKILERWTEIWRPDILEHLHEKLGIPAVLVHGDLWSSNVLWRKVDNSRELAAIVDWQVVHPGCAAEDLVRYMSCALSTQDRRDHLYDILEHYYSVLTKKMGGSPPFTYEQLKETFDRIYPLAMALILVAFGPIMEAQLNECHPDLREQFRSVMHEKAFGLAEDVIYYYDLNKQL